MFLNVSNSNGGIRPALIIDLKSSAWTKGEKVTEPSLAPAASGSWDWDFSKPVNSDIEIEWK